MKQASSLIDPDIPAHRRHDISDHIWQLLEPHLPGRRGVWGGVGRDNRQFINAIFWILRTGARWRDLPPDYGDWKNTHRRFCRWRDKGVWESLLEVLIDTPDFEWLMIPTPGSGCMRMNLERAGINHQPFKIRDVDQYFRQSRIQH